MTRGAWGHAKEESAAGERRGHRGESTEERREGQAEGRGGHSCGIYGGHSSATP